jgi:hypothetical protein
VVALASAHSQVSQSALVKNATEAAISVAMFVAVLAKLNRKLNLIRPKRGLKRSAEHYIWSCFKRVCQKYHPS